LTETGYWNRARDFFVDEDIIVTRYSMVSQADNIIFSPMDTDEKYTCSQYIAVDRINDIILLKTENLNRNPVELFPGTAPNTAKTMYISASPGKTLQLFTGELLNQTTVQGSKLYRITNRIRNNTFGAPVFVSNQKSHWNCLCRCCELRTAKFCNTINIYFPVAGKTK
jgi:peptidyl-prolyl cis-trans isomerase A (cyclophilin A)